MRELLEAKNLREFIQGHELFKIFFSEMCMNNLNYIKCANLFEIQGENSLLGANY